MFRKERENINALPSFSIYIIAYFSQKVKSLFAYSFVGSTRLTTRRGRTAGGCQAGGSRLNLPTNCAEAARTPPSIDHLFRSVGADGGFGAVLLRFIGRCLFRAGRSQRPRSTRVLFVVPNEKAARPCVLWCWRRHSM